MSEFWETDLSQTVRNAERLIQRKTRAQDAVDWLEKYADVGPTSSNQGVADLPFQRWFRFKEAFSPKFVADVLGSVPYRVDRCLDPFGGSGTSALTCRMLGLRSISVEVNPFLADLIRAKLTPISAAAFTEEYEAVISYLRPSKVDDAPIPGMPRTLKQPGVDGKFVFSADVYRSVRAILRRSEAMHDDHARLLRVLLGSILVPNSNVVINGKGRRYRRDRGRRPKTASDVIGSLDEAIDTATADLTKFAGLPRGHHRVLGGDARSELAKVPEADIAIFSPPYPNSFDYTDVYNLELWMLGYLGSPDSNTALRRQTLRSHVQTRWADTPRLATSKCLQAVVRALSRKRAELWNRHLPEMIGFYFDDLYVIFRHLTRILQPGHHAVVAIGDSQYAGVHVDVGQILVECIDELGFRLSKRGEIRSMRTSSQHGGSFDLCEHCLVFERT